MKTKLQLALFISLVLLLISSVMGCGLTGTQGNDLDDYLNNGYAHIEEGKYEEAINDFTQALELDRDSAEGLIGRAIANAWAGNYTRTENDFNTAYSISYERFMTADAYVAWGIALTAQYSSYSKLDEAEYLLNSAISLNPNNADAYTGRALMHLKEAYGDVIEAESIGFHRLSDATSDFEKAIELDPEGIQGRIKRFNFEGDMAFLPNYIEANKRCGAVLVNTDIYRSKGLEEYDRVLEVYPDDVEALFGRGSAYMRLQQYDLALRDFVKASDLEPDNPHAYAGCTSVDQLLLKRGDAYLDHKEWNEAISAYTEAIEHNPIFAEAYAQRALAILLDQEYNLTKDCLDKRGIRDTEKALELNPALDLDKRLARAYVFQGDCYHFNMDYEESIIYYTKGLELDPNIGCRRPIDVYWELIYDSLTDHEYDKAIEYANKAIELNTGDNDYYYRQLAEAYYGRGYEHYRHSGFPFDEAIADSTMAIELDPTNAKYYLSRAGIYETLADVYRDHGEVSEEVDSYNKAIADYTKAIELDPEAAWVYFGRGQCYAGNGDYIRAITDFTKAIELGREDWSVYFNRAYAYKELGDKNKALADYRKTLELTEDDFIREQSLKYIEELESD